MFIKSIIENPSDLYFDTLDKNEVIQLVIRKHWFILLKKLLKTFVVFITPLIIGVLMELNLNSNILILSLLYIWVGVFLFINFQIFLLWYYNVDIITNNRIVNLEFIYPFYKKESQISLTRIQDMSDVTNGFFPSIFNYGDLRIQSAGETSDIQIVMDPSDEKENGNSNYTNIASGIPNFIFKSIPNVSYVQKRIQELSLVQTKKESF